MLTEEQMILQIFGFIRKEGKVTPTTPYCCDCEFGNLFGRLSNYGFTYMIRSKVSPIEVVMSVALLPKYIQGDKNELCELYNAIFGELTNSPCRASEFQDQKAEDQAMYSQNRFSE